VAIDVPLTRQRRIRVLIERLQTTCLIVHRWDVQPDEQALELPASEARWVLEEWYAGQGPRPSSQDLVDAVRALDDQLPWSFRQPDDDDLDVALRNRLDEAIDRGELTVIEFDTPGRAEPAGAVRPVIKRSDARRPPAPPPREPTQHWYKVRVVDEFGAPVSGVMIKLEIEGQPLRKPTDGNGDARLEYPDGGKAKLEIANLASLEKTLLQRWTKRLPRVPTPAGAAVVQLGQALDQMSTTSESTRVIVISDRTWIGVELKDQDGEPVGGAKYVVTDVEGGEHSGELGKDGKARVAPVPRGDATVVFPEYDDERDWDAWEKAKDGKLATKETGPVAAPKPAEAQPAEAQPAEEGVVTPIANPRV
jgi:hypothetical protein